MPCPAPIPSAATHPHVQVVIAFLAIPLATLIVLVVAWFHNALPGLGDQPMDLHLKRVLCALLTRRSYRNTPGRPETVAALEGLLVTLSDQLLFGGLAILVAAFAKVGITVHSFRFVAALAGLSSSAHLATIVALKNRMRQPSKTKCLRAAMMLVQGGLHLASRLFESTVSHRGNDSDIEYRPWLDIFCHYKYGSVQVFRGILFGAWFVTCYAKGIVNMFVDSPGKPSQSWPMAVLMRFRSRPDTPRLSNLDVLRKGLAKKPDLMREFAASEFFGSFGWDLAWLVGALVYGLYNIIDVWLSCAQPADGPVSCWTTTLNMGFGQIAALVLLLILPFNCLDAYGAVKAARPRVDASASYGNPFPQRQPLGSSPASQTRLSRPGEDDLQFIQGGGDAYETFTFLKTSVTVFAALLFWPMVFRVSFIWVEGPTAHYLVGYLWVGLIYFTVYSYQTNRYI